jgi:predicted nuclease with TOPRIM domain
MNIQHFDRAVTAESRMETLERNQASIETKYLDFQTTMQRRFDELEKKLGAVQEENTSLRKEVNRLRATYEGDDGDGGQLVNGESGK